MNRYAINKGVEESDSENNRYSPTTVIKALPISPTTVLLFMLNSSLPHN